MAFCFAARRGERRGNEEEDGVLVFLDLAAFDFVLVSGGGVTDVVDLPLPLPSSLSTSTSASTATKKSSWSAVVVIAGAAGGGAARRAAAA